MRREARVEVRGRFEDASLLALKVEGGPWVQSCIWTLESKKDEGIDSSLEHPEGMQVMLVPEFSPVMTSDIQNYKIIALCCLDKFTVIRYSNNLPAVHRHMAESSRDQSSWSRAKEPHRLPTGLQIIIDSCCSTSLNFGVISCTGTAHCYTDL